MGTLASTLGDCQAVFAVCSAVCSASKLEDPDCGMILLPGPRLLVLVEGLESAMGALLFGSRRGTVGMYIHIYIYVSSGRFRLMA